MVEHVQESGGTRHKLKKLWAGLIAPLSTDEMDARRELMTRVILLTLSGIQFLATVLVFIGWLAGFFLWEDLATLLTILLFMVAGWLLVLWGHWRVSRFILLFILFSLGVYGSSYGGLLTTFILAYLIAVLLYAMLIGGRSTWILAGVVILVHLWVGQTVEHRSFIDLMTTAIPYSGLIIVGAALIQFAMGRLQIALTDAHRSAEELRNQIQVRELAEAELLKRNQELLVLNRVIAAATSSLEITEILQTALQELANGLRVPQSGAALLQTDRNNLEVVAVYPKEREAGALGVLIPIEGNLSTQYVMETRKALAIADAQNDARTAPVHETLREHGVASILILPLIVRDQVLGTIGLDSFERREFTEEEIALASNAALAAAQAIENAQLYAKVQRLAIHDELTDLLNRRGFIEFGQREFDRSRRFERGLTLIFMDVDDFREINERYGHAGGDVILRNLGMLINQSLRDIDLVGRYGGDEFIVLLTETGLTAGVEVAERLRGIIHKTPMSIGSVDFHATVSMGVAELAPKITELPELIAIADKALYQAKKAGRNRVEISR
jgi:diguanylate cyclase (GGDEF)-like protein